MGEPSNRLLFGFHSIIAVSGPSIWNLFGISFEPVAKGKICVFWIFVYQSTCSVLLILSTTYNPLHGIWNICWTLIWLFTLLIINIPNFSLWLYRDTLLNFELSHSEWGVWHRKQKGNPKLCCDSLWGGLVWWRTENKY